MRAKKISLGLKLFASNIHLYKNARYLLDQGFFEYIELYTPPGSEEFLTTWADNQTLYVIHGPHMVSGVNWADHALRKDNRAALTVAQRYADTLHAPHIIIHGGFMGPIEEVAKQIDTVILAGESRLLLENTPKHGINREISTIHLPSHINYIQNYVGVNKLGFVLDIGHAIYTANSFGYEHMFFLQQFNMLSPKIYHLSDGDRKSLVDVHKNIGEGDFNLTEILNFIPVNAQVTVETPKNLAMGLKDARVDAERLLAL